MVTFIEKTFGPQIKIMNMMGILAPEKYGNNWKGSVYIFVSVIFICFILSPLLDIIQCIQHPEKVRDLLRTVYEVVAYNIAVMKSVTIVIQSPAIIKIFKDINCLFDTDLVTIAHGQLPLRARHIIYATRFFIFVTYLSVVVSMINTTMLSDTPFTSLPNPVIFNIDISESPAYELIFVYQITVTVIRVSQYLVATFLSVSFMYLSFGIFDILKHDIKNILKHEISINENDYVHMNIENINANFIQCIKFHQGIFRIIAEFTGLIHWIFLATFGGVLIFNGIILYILSTSSFNMREINGYAGFIVINVELLIFNYFGNRMENQHNDLLEILSECGWYKYTNNKVFSQNLPIIMIRFQKPVTVKAGKIYPLSLLTYLAILKTSYSYFALLKNFNN